MSSSGATAAEEATHIIKSAEGKGTVLRLLGGVAVYLRCPSARSGSLSRDYGDIDFIGHVRQSSEIKRLLISLGYVPRERFNAIHGHRRLTFDGPGQQKRIDVFLDVFEMCHKLDLKERMEIDLQTIPLADLLATKLQIIEMNEKDVVDAVSLLVDHKIGGTDLQDTINCDYLARLCSDDWGIYKTFTMKLAALPAQTDTLGLKEADKVSVLERVEWLKVAIEEAPKSLAWKMRAAIGERVRWYELPEDTGETEQIQARGS